MMNITRAKMDQFRQTLCAGRPILLLTSASEGSGGRALGFVEMVMKVIAAAQVRKRYTDSSKKCGQKPL